MPTIAQPGDVVLVRFPFTDLTTTKIRPAVVLATRGDDLTIVGIFSGRLRPLQLTSEAVKVRRCPGILFADGPSGRRARIVGTGLDVWEVIATYKSLDHDVARLCRAYHWFTEPQLRAALGYYAAYPDEIEQQIARNEAWTKERLARQHPALASNRP